MSFNAQVTLDVSANDPQFVERLLKAIDDTCGDVAAAEEASVHEIARASAHNNPQAPKLPKPDPHDPELTKRPDRLDRWLKEKGAASHAKALVIDMLQAGARAAEAMVGPLVVRGVRRVTVQLAGHVETDPAHAGFHNVHVWPA